MIESLETRWLFALPPVGHSTVELVNMTLSRGTLTITGWNGRDNINVAKEGANLVVRAYGGKMTSNSSSVMPTYSTLIKSFAASLVANIQANLNGGNDAFRAVLSGPSISALGGTGNDSITAYSDGAVVADGQDGNDRVIGSGWITSVVKGGIGNDYVRGGASYDEIFGGDGDDVCVGGDFEDIIYGQAGDDTLVGGFGADTMYGGADDDYLCKWMSLAPWGDSVGGGDTMEGYGGAGDDTITFQGGNGAGGFAYGGAGNDLLIGYIWDDVFDGGAGLDTFQGNGGDDTYYANDGEQDVIYATTGGGNDTIFSDVLDIVV